MEKGRTKKKKKRVRRPRRLYGHQSPLNAPTSVSDGRALFVDDYFSLLFAPFFVICAVLSIVMMMMMMIVVIFFSLVGTLFLFLFSHFFCRVSIIRFWWGDSCVGVFFLVFFKLRARGCWSPGRGLVGSAINRLAPAPTDQSPCFLYRQSRLILFTLCVCVCVCVPVGGWVCVCASFRSPTVSTTSCHPILSWN